MSESTYIIIMFTKGCLDSGFEVGLLWRLQTRAQEVR